MQVHEGHRQRAQQHGHHGGNPAVLRLLVRAFVLAAAWLPAPAKVESAARPVSVIVSTVVVMSGTARRRTVALRTPIAKGQQRDQDVAGPARRHRGCQHGDQGRNTGQHRLGRHGVSSSRRRLALTLVSRVPAQPAQSAPARKSASEVRVAVTENPARARRGEAENDHIAGHVGREHMAEAR